MLEPERYGADELVDCALLLLEKVGLRAAMARDVAETLVEADLLGHDTHGLALLAPYLNELDRGQMARDGSYQVLAERPAVANWDGQRLPGPWLVRRAIDWAHSRARTHGMATVTLRRSHHIACLAAYLEPIARAGLMGIIASSDPAVASVAPFGGTQAVMTPNPLAVAIPTSGDPILVDVSMSVTTNGLSGRLRAAGKRGPHKFWLDSLGQATDDPGVIFAQPPGTILPLGGVEAGHKGYGLGLTIEALTSALAGYGRADLVEGWGANVFVQLLDPDAFGGVGAFTWQTDYLAQACRGSTPRSPDQPVRLPGERALARKREQLRDGVALHEAILPALQPWSTRLEVPLPIARQA